VANIPKVWNGTAFIELEAAATVAPAASTTVVGIVQLTDSTSSTSTTTAATPNSVKSAFDLAAAARPKLVATNAQTGTAYTLVIGDADKLVEMSNAAAITLTIPTNSSVAFPTGTQIDLLQTGAGQVTVGGAGVTLQSEGSKLKLKGQYAAATLIKRATDTWVLIGNTSA
jgi:hypothetical protein